jgi:uncharacterized phage protein gp47/JayE
MSYSEGNSFDDIMSRCLSHRLLNSVDKRVGSLIYDAMAPLALELAEAYVKMDIMQDQTFFMTATGDNLDRRVADNGLVRSDATKAQRTGTFKCYKLLEDGSRAVDADGNYVLEDLSIPVGSRFCTVNQNAPLYFRYTGDIDGQHILECETDGTAGNEYVGTLLPVNTIAYLVEAKIVSTYKAGEDRETDEELRERQRIKFESVSFGGNISDYIEKLNAVDGVGNTKVFPAWACNGAVLVSCVDPSYNPLSPEFVARLQEQVDPPERTGQGVGIAPIGHFVTVTTPVRRYISISAVLVLDADVTVQSVRGRIESAVDDYFREVRHSYRQGKTLAVLRARVSQRILGVPGVINAVDIYLDGNNDDIFLYDEQSVDGQFLPYIGELELV